jgi:hypothetical protein
MRARLSLQGTAQALRQDCDAVAHPFAFTDGNLAIAKVEVLDPQTQAFEETQSASA